jgi:hypothetical protein
LIFHSRKETCAEIRSGHWANNGVLEPAQLRARAFEPHDVAPLIGRVENFAASPASDIADKADHVAGREFREVH